MSHEWEEEVWETTQVLGGIEINFDEAKDAIRAIFLLNDWRKKNVADNPALKMYAVRRPRKEDDGSFVVCVVLREKLLPSFLGLRDPKTGEPITLVDAYDVLEKREQDDRNV